MRFIEVVGDKREYMDLLLMGDEQESMIERYLDECELYALDDGGVKAVCAVVCDGEVAEIKNLAVAPEWRRMGYGRACLRFVEARYGDRVKALKLCTGLSDSTVPFYERCGFETVKVVRGYFIENYDRPIYENGKRLTDMVVMIKRN